MSYTIRIATIEDAPEFLFIKNQLTFTRVDGTMVSGGFLLGSDLETYQSYIAEAYCLVAEVDNSIVGFGIVFPNELLRRSDIWQKRYSAEWKIDILKYEIEPICYFEQLGFISGNRKAAVALAYNLVKWAFDSGCKYMFATTISAPVKNIAAVPFIQAINGIHAGTINEDYPKIGRVCSDIYLMHADKFYFYSHLHPLYPFLKESVQVFV